MSVCARQTFCTTCNSKTNTQISSNFISSCTLSKIIIYQLLAKLASKVTLFCQFFFFYFFFFFKIARSRFLLHETMKKFMYETFTIRNNIDSLCLYINGALLYFFFFSINFVIVKFLFLLNRIL